MNALKQQGYQCVDEVAREIIAEQILQGGDALHTKNQIKFRDLMLHASIKTYLQMQDESKPVYFDRGIPDLLGYCQLINCDIPAELVAAVDAYRYNPMVYVAPPWKEIYKQDELRQQGWQEAVATYENICAGYLKANYTLVELPMMSVQDRVQYLINR